MIEGKQGKRVNIPNLEISLQPFVTKIASRAHKQQAHHPKFQFQHKTASARAFGPGNR